MRIVRPIHERARPVMLTTPARIEQWLEAPMAEALTRCVCSLMPEVSCAAEKEHER